MKNIKLHNIMWKWERRKKFKKREWVKKEKNKGKKYEIKGK